MGADDGKRKLDPPSAYLRVVSAQGRDPARHYSAAAERNIPPILEVLRDWLPRHGRALEIASGTGQHVVAVAQAFPDIQWQPSDPDPAARSSIEAWSAEMEKLNVAPPLDLDVMRQGWADHLPTSFDAVVAINLLHISPWAATQGLMAGAGQLLAPGGLLYIYGCFKREGAHISQSNVDFDAALRRCDQRWGVRDSADVVREAERHGLRLEDMVAMPANNFSLIFLAH